MTENHLGDNDSEGDAPDDDDDLDEVNLNTMARDIMTAMASRSANMHHVVDVESRKWGFTLMIKGLYDGLASNYGEDAQYTT